MLSNTEEIIDKIFEAELRVDPVTFQPEITITGHVTYELMQDLHALLDTEECYIFLGRAVTHAIKNTKTIDNAPIV